MISLSLILNLILLFSVAILLLSISFNELQIKFFVNNKNKLIIISIISIIISLFGIISLILYINFT